MRRQTAGYLKPHVERIEAYLGEWMLDNFLLTRGIARSDGASVELRGVEPLTS